jgi:16S rRNA (guanine527-N7)-methyltransferase
MGSTILGDVKPATIAMLGAEAERLGVTLDGRALERFAAYARLLERWNARINLTRITGDEDVVAKHFLDSLAVAAMVGDARTLVDVGAGPGFPGVPAAIGQTHLAVSLVESIRKKCAFLEAVKRELDLPQLTVHAERLERFVDRGGSGFDVAVSRATFAPAEWVERGAALVAPGGMLIAMLGKERPTLVPPPGFAAPELHAYTLPPLPAGSPLASLERKESVSGERALAILRRAR